MKSLLFWDFTQQGQVVHYRHFRTAYRSHLQASSMPECLTLEDGKNPLKFSNRPPVSYVRLQFRSGDISNGRCNRN